MADDESVIELVSVRFETAIFRINDAILPFHDTVAFVASALTFGVRHGMTFHN